MPHNFVIPTGKIHYTRQETLNDAATIEGLHERAFGPGRFARAATRLREHRPTDLKLSFVALVGNLIVGSVRVTPILAGGNLALFLGPLTVDPAFESKGIGKELMENACSAAQEGKHNIMFLVGDQAYYSRFGFKSVPEGHAVLPAPVDLARVLYLELKEGALAAAKGIMTPLKA
jgi:predicted N-acetyltransferase YhbS